MDDSEIHARLEHEAAMREQIAQDLRTHDEWSRARWAKAESWDRWRWGVGIIVGIMLSRSPDGLAWIIALLD